MTPPLRIPAALVVVIAGSAAVTAVAVGCGDDLPSPVDASGSACRTFCIPTGSTTGSACPPPTCVDSNGMCPTGCEPEPLG